MSQLRESLQMKSDEVNTDMEAFAKELVNRLAHSRALGQSARG